ncbi:hypothetical protein ACFLQ0_02905 [Nitrospinota bacterium]
MNRALPAWEFLIAAGRINRGQQQVIDCLIEEDRVLKEHFRGRRMRLTDAERRGKEEEVCHGISVESSGIFPLSLRKYDNIRANNLTLWCLLVPGDTTK